VNWNILRTSSPGPVGDRRGVGVGTPIQQVDDVGLVTGAGDDVRWMFQLTREGPHHVSV